MKSYQDVIHSLANLNGDLLTKEDFVAAFEKVVAVVQELRENVKESEKKISGELVSALDEISTLFDKKLANSFESASESVDKKLATLADKLKSDIAAVKGGSEALSAQARALITASADTLSQKIDDVAAKTDELGDALRLKMETDDDLYQAALQGLKEEIESVKTMAATKSGGHGGTAVNSVQYFDCSSQCDGANKIFRVPNYRYAISLQGTQYPNTYRPYVDFTYGNKTITLTSEVGAPEAGQTLIFIYVK